MNDLVLESFYSVGFKGLATNNIQLDFKKNEFTLVLDEFDEVFGIVRSLNVIFQGVYNFSFDSLVDSKFVVQGLEEASIKKIDTARYQVHLVFEFNMGFIWTISIDFRSIVIERELSELSLEFKNTKFHNRFEEILWFENRNLKIPNWLQD